MVVFKDVCSSDLDSLKQLAEDARLRMKGTPSPAPVPAGVVERKFQIGERVTKIKGSKWTGKVVGFYSTDLTPVGYAVESETETGSVQIYPEAALQALKRGV